MELPTVSQQHQFGEMGKATSPSANAKLQGPPRRKRDLLARPELLSNVASSAETNSLTLVIAGSGYGKSVLLSQVYDELVARSLPCLWLTLNQEAPNSLDLPDRLKKQIAALLQEVPRPTDDFVSLLRDFAGNSEVTVFVDNWNFAETQDTNRYFELLLSETQGLARFVVSSRSTPSFQFEHLMLEDDARVLAAKDLAFTHDEALSLLQANINRDNASLIKELIQRTEGWPVGLLLLKHLLEQGSGTQATLEFSGSRTEVANYLNKSLFQSAPRDRQNFLVALSHLHSFSAEMITFLFDDPGRANDLLKEVNNNSFIVQDSDAEQMFRFHLLFQEFLKDQKTDELEPPLPTLLVRACDWHLQRGETALAISYALRIGDRNRITQLLSDYSENELGKEGNAQLFVEWIREAQRLGCDLSSNLSYWYQWCLIFGGQWRQVQDKEIAALPSREQTVIRAVHSVFSDDQSGLIASVASWKNNGEFGNELTNSGMYGASAICELGKGDFRRAQTELNRAMFSVEKSTSIFARCWLMVLDSFLALYRGRVIDAETHAWKAVNLAEHRLIDNRGVNRLVRQIAGLMTWYRGYDHEAREEFGNVPSANQEFGLPVMTMMVASAIRHLEVKHRLALPEGWLRSSATRLVHTIDKIEFHQMNGGPKSEIYDQLRELDDQVVFASGSGLDVHSAFWNLRNRYEMLQARQDIINGLPEDALKKITPVISRCQKDSNALLQNHAELLRAAALWQFDKHHEAQRQLIRTTERAFDGGLVRPILLEKALVEPILPNLIKAGDRATIGRDPAVWRVFKRAIGQSGTDEKMPIVTEVVSAGDLQLTDRELELVGFLDAGLSNQDIADRLSIKLSTVKWHLNNLFSKLNVKNRTSAVRFAKDSGLL